MTEKLFTGTLNHNQNKTNTDFKPAINKYLLNKWQLVWDTAVDNKHPIKSILPVWRPALRAEKKTLYALG